MKTRPKIDFTVYNCLTSHKWHNTSVKQARRTKRKESEYVNKGCLTCRCNVAVHFLHPGQHNFGVYLKEVQRLILKRQVWSKCLRCSWNKR